MTDRSDWECPECGYLNNGPICTKCGQGIEPDVKVERMTNTALRDRLARLFHDNVTPRPWTEADEWEREAAYELADVALAALALNDLDAAQERARRALLDLMSSVSASEWYEAFWPLNELSRVALEAAFTATPESENTDG
jgi:hypothetical protein